MIAYYSQIAARLLNPSMHRPEPADQVSQRSLLSGLAATADARRLAPNMRVPSFFSEAIARYWFRRIVRDPIPDNVCGLSAVIFPVPVIRRGNSLLVKFRFRPPFERDVQFWGWREWKKGLFVERTIVYGFARTAGIKVGRLYSLEPLKGETPEWMAFDESENIGCFGYLGRKSMSDVHNTVKTVLGDRAA